MDTIVPRRRGKKIIIGAAAGVLAVAAAIALWSSAPRGFQVPASEVRTATVEQGIFYDDVVMRSKAESLNSVILDSVESGKVEEVFAHDGALVKKGETLFRISNPARHLELLQRQAEHTQQISNLSNLKVAFEAGNTEHERRHTELTYNLEQARKKHARNVVLAEKGFISEATLAESADLVAQHSRTLQEEAARARVEGSVKSDAVLQMSRAIKNIETGLALVNETVDALAVRAPVAGRLTDFNLQVGQAVKNDQHIGRIDDPEKFKLAAQVDEYYLSRVAVGHKGAVQQDGKSYPVEVSRVFPQIKEGRFSIELVFKDGQPSTLNPGQGIDATVTLGEPRPALLLPNAPWLSDTGGSWVFVLAPNGVDAEKRELKTGRRNNRQVEVLSGLKAGEKVIVSSYSTFGNAVRLQVKK